MKRPLSFLKVAVEVVELIAADYVLACRYTVNFLFNLIEGVKSNKLLLILLLKGYLITNYITTYSEKMHF